MAKPMLRRGYYIVPGADETFHYFKVTCDVENDGSLCITKGPEAVSTQDGFIVLSSKTVYKVTIHDIYRCNVPADARLNLDTIENTFIKYTPGNTFINSGASGFGASTVATGPADSDAELENQFREADEAIENQVQVLLG